MVSAFSTTCHVGTHVDAPAHLDPGGVTVDQIPLERLIGDVEVVEVTHRDAVIDVADLPPSWIPSTPRVLIRTGTYPLGSPIDAGFAGLAPDLVEWLAHHGVLTVGIDTPSVDAFDADDAPTHRALLRLGMTWIEGLFLEAAAPGRYRMVALPLALVGVEAAPVRVILQPR
jgi:arylformamidase